MNFLTGLTKFIPSFEGSAEMRNDDRAAHYKSDVQRFLDFVVCITGFETSYDMIFNTIIAAQDQRSRQTQELFGSGGEGAVAITLSVNAVETLDFEAGVVHYDLIQPFAL